MTARLSGEIDHVHDARTLWGRLLRYWLGPLFYWMDVLDDQRRPSHTKFTWTVAFFWMMGLFTQLDVLFVRNALAQGRTLNTAEILSLISFGALAVCTAGGLNGFKVWSKRGGGGTVEALGQAASAEIQARRDSVGGDHEPTD